MTEKSKGGRPRHGAEVKNAPLNMRTSPELRERIEKAADLWGHSLSSEVARRLISSFHYEDAMQGAFISAFAQLMASTIRAIEEQTGKGWHEDFATYRAVQAAADKLLAWHRPAPPTNTKADKLFARLKETRAARDEATKALDDYRLSLGIVSIDGRELPATPSRPKPVGGMLGASLTAVAPATTPRDRMTAEERARELELIEQQRAAADADAAVHEQLMAIYAPIHEATKAAEAMGADTAAKLFAELGPKQRA